MNATESLVRLAPIGEFPKDATYLKALMFDRCRTVDECRRLLEFYSAIVRLPAFDEREFARALEERRLVEYLLRIHKGFASRQFTWFKLNLERWLFGGS